MQRSLLWLRVPSALGVLCAAALLQISAAMPVSSRAPEPGNGSAVRLLVHYRPNTAAANVAEIEGGAGARLVKEVPHIGVRVLQVPREALDNALAALKGNAAVDYAEPDIMLQPQDVLPNDPSFPQTYAVGGGAWGWTMTHTTQAWGVTKGDPAVVIAILDTGIKTSGLTDFNGQISSTWNVLNNSADATTNAGKHGTYVAGIAGLALGNGAGNAGYCPGCRLMIVQVGTDAGVYLSDAASGLVWAADHGARIANMSFGGSSDSSTLRSAITYAHSKGLVMTAAAGNSNCNCVTYPAADPYVIGVAGVDNSGNKAGDSNYGSWVSVAAPEGGLTAWPSINGAPGYAPVGGTSSAAPVVAGIAGVLFSANTALTSTLVEQALESTAIPVSFSVQYGRVDTLAALASLGFSDPQPASAPVNTAAPQLMVEINGDWNYQALASAPQVGQVLLRGQGGWTGSAPLSLASVQWVRCDSTGAACSVVATAAKYTVQSTDAGYAFRFVVLVSNGLGSVSLASSLSAAVGSSSTATVYAPTNTSSPTISGTAQAGQTLTASPGTWSGSPTSYGYQWQGCDTSGANCAAISGATTADYLVQTADVGLTLRVVVTASNSAGSAAATSTQTAVVAAASVSAPANTSAPTISGTAQAGQTLTASTGLWSGSPTGYAYQWQDCDSSGANCNGIAGATGSSYVLQTADAGLTLRVVVTASNSAGSATAVSAPTVVVASAPTTTQTLTFSSSLNPGNPTRTFTVTVGSGQAVAQMSFSRCTSLTLSLSTGAASKGPSVLVLSVTLAAGTYTYQVSGGKCSFNLTVTAPSP